MKALVVYDSTYGNTKSIAVAVGTIIGASVVHVSEASAEMVSHLDLLLVGSPTVSGHPTKAIEEFLAKLPQEIVKGLKASAFDTRLAVKHDLNIGFAVSFIAHALKKSGCVMVGDMKGFIVKSADGALEEGETDKAVAWAKDVLEKALH